MNVIRILCQLSFYAALSINFAHATLLLHYDFNGDALDKSGNSLHGTIQGGPSFTAGESDLAMYINNPSGSAGATQYVTVPNSPVLQALANASFTLAIKYKSTDTSQNNGRLLGNRTAAGKKGFNLTYNDGLLANGYATIAGSTAEISTQVESNATPNGNTTDGEFHWVIATVDRATDSFNFYVDAHKITTKVITGIGSIDFDDISLGRITGFPNFGARQTTMDDFRIYNTAFSQSNVNQLVNASEPSSLMTYLFAIIAMVWWSWRRAVRHSFEV